MSQKQIAICIIICALLASGVLAEFGIYWIAASFVAVSAFAAGWLEALHK